MFKYSKNQNLNAFIKGAEAGWKKACKKTKIPD